MMYVQLYLNIKCCDPVHVLHGMGCMLKKTEHSGIVTGFPPHESTSPEWDIGNKYVNRYIVENYESGD